MRNLILSTLSILALLIHPLSLSGQNSFSVSLDVDGDSTPGFSSQILGQWRTAICPRIKLSPFRYRARIRLLSK